jgi:hypothetical protein
MGLSLRVSSSSAKEEVSALGSDPLICAKSLEILPKYFCWLKNTTKQKHGG